MTLSLPPIIKVYEAFSAVADRRFTLTGSSAVVHSSNGAKTYDVQWEEGSPLRMTANDNGTYYKDYVGYPLITVLMALDKLRYNKTVLQFFQNIDWNALNKRLDNDYDLAVAEVLTNIPSPQQQEAKNCAKDILRQLSQMTIARLGNKEDHKPPA